MSKRIANSRSKNKARNGRIKLSWRARRHRDRLQTKLDSLHGQKKNMPVPTVMQKVKRFFRRGVR